MTTLDQQFIKFALKQKIASSKRFLKLKKQFYSERQSTQPTNADLREEYEKMVSQKKIKRKKTLEKAMQARAVRTQSGVAVVAVLTKPYPCPGQCAFCPNEKNMPKSYLSNEPAVMRAILNKFHPYRQVQNRLYSLLINGHPIDKIELIVMGGTFSYFPKRYQRWFVKECFRACNEFSPSTFQAKKRKKPKKTNLSLNAEQKRNENASVRIVGLTLETRPDWIDQEEIINFRELGCTRVELGVQSIFDDVLKKNKRGHSTAVTIQATRLLKQAGFKINYHLMPGLPGSSPQKDLEMFKEIFRNPDFQPDMLKIYPTLVIKNSLLYRWWKKDQYQPLSNKDFEKLIIKVKNEIIPPYVRIQRLVRDVPLPAIEAGPNISNLRQIIAPKTNCQCIRCREIKNQLPTKGKIKLQRIDYPASQGKEIFLQFIDQNNKLYSLLRLRINRPDATDLPKALKNSAIIRELHTYGQLTSLKQKSKHSPQHHGLGKKLLQLAEKISRQELSKLGIPTQQQKIAVISSVGVRNYYRRHGYRLQETYLVKKLHRH